MKKFTIKKIYKNKSVDTYHLQISDDLNELKFITAGIVLNDDVEKIEILRGWK